MQGKILTDGVALHNEVCPETMRKLHERMEELLKEYLSKYGDLRQDNSAYDMVSFFDLNSPDHQSRKRKFSSSRRRDVIRGRPQSGTYERSQTVSGNSPILERKTKE